MNKYSQKYTIVCFTEDVNAGDDFPASNWPDHLTLVDIFSIDGPPDSLSACLHKLANITPRQSTIVQNHEFFGPNSDISVAIVDRSLELHELHSRILGILSQFNVKYDNPDRIDSGFLPHVTMKNGFQIPIGTVIELNNIALVDMFPGDDHLQRKILSKYTLKSD